MPNPYSPPEGATWFHLTPDTPVYRPHLGVDLARVTHYWSDIELFWSIAYAYLMAGKDDVAAFTEYYNLRDWRKRRKQFFDQAKKHGLPSNLKNEATDLYAEFESLAITRNRIAHGNWAWSERHNDSIFLAQPRSIGINVNRIFTAMHNIAHRPDRYSTVSVDFNRGPYEEWTHADFEKVVSDFLAFRDKVSAFADKVVAHSLRVFSGRLPQHP